jgi:hypothetical protein
MRFDSGRAPTVNSATKVFMGWLVYFATRAAGRGAPLPLWGFLPTERVAAEIPYWQTTCRYGRQETGIYPKINHCKDLSTWKIKFSGAVQRLNDR